MMRDAGKSLLPFARVQKIIKADKDIPIVAKEATFLISLATEEFIKRLSETSQKAAGSEKRVTVQQRDIANAVRNTIEFVFLEEIIPLAATEIPTRRKLKGKWENLNGETDIGTSLDSFIQKGAREGSETATNGNRDVLSDINEIEETMDTEILT